MIAFGCQVMRYIYLKLGCLKEIDLKSNLNKVSIQVSIPQICTFNGVQNNGNEIIFPKKQKL